jgi:hypothetical protein
VQEVISSSECRLEVVQLAPGPEPTPDGGLRNLVEHFIPEQIDVCTDALFATKLLRITANEHVLVIAAEHMIWDAVSLNILMRDLWFAYGRIVNGRPVAWAGEAGSFADHATSQRSTLPSRLHKHHDWIADLASHERLRFPASREPPDPADSSWTYTTIRIRSELKAALQSWCRLHQTTPVMCVFTAYAASVLRWCGATKGIIQYRWDGRLSPRDDNVIGYFASMLYLLVELEDDTRILDLLHHAVQRYCDAFERADFSYVEAQLPRLELCCNPTFNWIPRGPETALPVAESPEGTLTRRPMEFQTLMGGYFECDNEPMTVVHEMSEEILLYVYFPRNRFSLEAMRRFGALLLTFVTTLLERPQTRVNDIVVR